jgi:hypothetical protein
MSAMGGCNGNSNDFDATLTRHIEEHFLKYGDDRAEPVD